MSPPDRSSLLPVALVLVSVLALVQGIAIVLLLTMGNARSAVTQAATTVSTSIPTMSVQAAQRTSTPATDVSSAVSEAPPEGDLPRGEVGQRVESGGFALTVQQIYHRPDPELDNIFDLDAGERYIAADILLENLSQNSYFYSSSQFRPKESAGFEYGETLD
jgi:hypothetical protein